jgi:hypothetical protein
VRVSGYVACSLSALLGTACGLSARDAPQPAEEATAARGGLNEGGNGGGAPSAGGAGGEPEPLEGLPCGPAAALCDVDRCADGACAFIEIARVPGPVYTTRVDATHVYVLGEYNTTIYRIPKCGGTASVVVRTVNSIGAFALSGKSLYWAINGRLFRSPSDGLGLTEEIVFDPPVASTHFVLMSDLTDAYAVAASGVILDLEEDGTSVLGNAPPGATVLWDAEFFYFHTYDKGTQRVTKLGAFEAQLLEPGPVPRAVDAQALYYGVSDPPAVANSRPPHGFFRLSKENGAREALVYLSTAPAGAAADGRCAYLTLFGETGSSEGMSTRRFRLDGREEAVVFSGEQHHITLDADALYVTSATGSVYRRPK